MKDRNFLHHMYNVTSTEHPPGSDELETYEYWLERQLLSRIEKIEELEKTLKQVQGDTSNNDFQGVQKW